MSSTGRFDTLIDDVYDHVLILVFEGVSLVSFVLIMILFWWCFLSFQNATTILSGRKLKYLCLISLLSFFLMSFIAAMLITNLVTQHLTLGMCQIIYPLYFIFYNIGKMSIYCLVSFRQQIIFNQDIYSEKLAISPIGSNIYRIFCIFTPSIFWVLFIFLGFNHIEIITVPNSGENDQDYKYCYMQVFKYRFYAQLILALIGIFDTLFRLMTLSIFITKSIKVTTYYKQNINTQKRDIITKLSKLLRKTNLLDVTSIICTLLFLVGSAYIFQQLIFFLIIDAVICSCCTIALFQFGDKLYKNTCFKCEPYCVCLYCLERSIYPKTKKKKIKTDGYQEFVDDMVNKNSVNLKETGNTPTHITPIPSNHDGDGGNIQNGINTTNTKSNQINVFESTNTTILHTTNSGLIQAGNIDDERCENRKNTAVTMLSGYEHIEPKELEITSDRVIEDRDNSLLSVSEFL